MAIVVMTCIPFCHVKIFMYTFQHWLSRFFQIFQVDICVFDVKQRGLYFQLSGNLA